MAAMWRMWLSLRFPLGLSLCRFLLPEDASIGAVALYEAKCPAVGNRPMSPTDPRIMAAPIGPIPRISHRLVPEAATASRIRFFDANICVSRDPSHGRPSRNVVVIPATDCGPHSQNPNQCNALDYLGRATVGGQTQEVSQPDHVSGIAVKPSRLVTFAPITTDLRLLLLAAAGG